MTDRWRPNFADAAYRVRERIEEGDYKSQEELLELKKEYRLLLAAISPSEDKTP